MSAKTNSMQQTPSTSGELSDHELDQVSGGFLHMLLPAWLADATFGDSMRKLSDAMGGSTQVVAGPDGQGDYRPHGNLPPTLGR